MSQFIFSNGVAAIIYDEYAIDYQPNEWVPSQCLVTREVLVNPIGKGKKVYFL
jgi:hypothetical protein